MRRIAQPYCVWWNHEDCNDTIDDWCRENMTEPYQFLIWGRDAILMEVLPDKVHREQIPNQTMLCMFESPRDAMLFKLTWVG